MNEIVLSGAHWNHPDDFYSDVLNSLGAPEWHGHNLDALWDSITAGGINEVNPPFRFRLTELGAVPPDCKAIINHFAELIEEARAQGFAVEILYR